MRRVVMPVASLLCGIGALAFFALGLVKHDTFNVCVSIFLTLTADWYERQAAK